MQVVPAAFIRVGHAIAARQAVWIVCGGSLTSFVRFPGLQRLRHLLADHVSGKRIRRWLADHVEMRDRLQAAATVKEFRQIWSIVVKEATR